jgi:hypothetical protein
MKGHRTEPAAAAVVRPPARALCRIQEALREGTLRQSRRGRTARARQARHVTLLYGARDPQANHAVVLKSVLKSAAGKRGVPRPGAKKRAKKSASTSPRPAFVCSRDHCLRQNAVWRSQYRDSCVAGRAWLPEINDIAFPCFCGLRRGRSACHVAAPVAKAMVSGVRRTRALSIPYLGIRTVSWSKRRLQSHAPRFCHQSSLRCRGVDRCASSSGVAAAL